MKVLPTDRHFPSLRSPFASHIQIIWKWRRRWKLFDWLQKKMDKVISWKKKVGLFVFESGK